MSNSAGEAPDDRDKLPGASGVVLHRAAHLSTPCQSAYGGLIPGHLPPPAAVREKARRQTAIALWLGHESYETTQIYPDAKLTLKEEALRKTNPKGAKLARFKPDDQLLAFLKNL
jgi:hypothetical protein